MSRSRPGSKRKQPDLPSRIRAGIRRLKTAAVALGDASAVMSEKLRPVDRAIRQFFRRGKKTARPARRARTKTRAVKRRRSA